MVKVFSGMQLTLVLSYDNISFYSACEMLGPKNASSKFVLLAVSITRYFIRAGQIKSHFLWLTFLFKFRNSALEIRYDFGEGPLFARNYFRIDGMCPRGVLRHRCCSVWEQKLVSVVISFPFHIIFGEAFYLKIISWSIIT